MSRTADIEVIKGIVKDLQHSQLLSVTWALPATNILICHDALIALFGGSSRGVGIVVAAGTGSIVFGRNHRGITKRIGGWGYILGDEGSAYKIAVAGMQSALKSYDGREKATSLVECFQKYLDLSSIEDLITVIYRQNWGVSEIANLAQIVDLVAALGDEVANQIIDDAVQELTKATSTVIETIFNPDSVLEIVTTGSVWKSRCKIHQRFAASIVDSFPTAKVSFPRYEPAYGAGLLALKKLVN